MPNVVLTSAHDNLVNYVLAHGLNPNVVIPLINQAAAEALAGWEVTGVSVTYAESADPYEAEATTRQFLAEVQGTGEYSQNVTWTVSGNISPLTVIDANGLLTVNASEFEDENEDPAVEHDLTITAISVDNPAISGSKTFTCITSTHSVTYDANGGSGTMTDDDGPYAEDATVIVKTNAFAPAAGKAFDYFAFDAAGVSATGATFDIDNSVTIYAIWKTVYTVNYNANGGTGDAPEEATFDSGTTITVAAANTFTPPTDKLFLEWNTAVDGSGVSYNPADEVVIGADTIFYAQWEDTIP